MCVQVAKKIAAITPSATLAVAAQTKAMKAQGQAVFDLSIGQPDFPTPAFIDAAAKTAIDANQASFYLPATGLPALKKAIATHLATRGGATYDPTQIVVTTGAKFALYSLFSVLLEPGDEVLVPIPAWVSYIEQIKLAGGRPILVPSAATFKVTPAQLEAQRGPATKAVIINSPQNPTGAVYSRAELQAIGDWAVAHGVLLIADDIYRDLIYHDVAYTSLTELSPETVANTVLISGVSKSYAMTGWRIGFAAGPRKLMQAMATFIGHTTGNATAVAQYAALAAYTGDDRTVFQMCDAFEKRLDLVWPRLSQLSGFQLEEKPQGAFYLFPRAIEAAQMTGFSTVDDFAAALLAKTGVAVVPGRAFGMPDHLRISYAASEATLKAALDRMQAFMKKYR